MSSKTTKSLVWSFGERITAQIVTLVVSIILARLLTPDQYAQVAIVMIFITIANAFVTGGFGNSLIQKKDSDDLDFSTTTIFSFVLSIALYILLFLIAPIISSYYEMPSLTLLIRVLGIRLIFASYNSIQHAYVSKRMEFKKFFYSTSIGTILSGVIGIILAYFGYGVWALVSQYLINTIIDTIVLSFTCGWTPSFTFSRNRMKTLFSYGWKLLAVTVGQTLYTQFRGLILSKNFDPKELSYYNQGDKFPALFVNNIDVSVNKVMFQRLCDEQENLSNVKTITHNTIVLIVFVLTPVYFFLASCSTELVHLLLTDKWLPCVPYMKVLCIIYVMFSVVSTQSRTIKALGRSDHFLYLSLVRYFVGVFIVFLIIFTIHNAFLVIASELLVYFMMFIATGVMLSKLIPYTLLEQIRDIYKPFLFCSIIYYIQSLIPELTNYNSMVLIISKVILGFIMYIVFNVIFNKEAVQTILIWISKKKKRV